jgi:5'-nucleotidase
MRGLDRVATRLARPRLAPSRRSRPARRSGNGRAARRPRETIQILGLNDFHGKSSRRRRRPISSPARHQEQLGGAARLGAALAQLRQGQPNTITVAAGDLIGGSPLVSAYFPRRTDDHGAEPPRLALASVGNHEFDRGTVELRRMQDGGCDKNTLREPCQLDRPFEGAQVHLPRGQRARLRRATRCFPAPRCASSAASGRLHRHDAQGAPASSCRPAGHRGAITFADEAETANALAARLRAEGRRRGGSC